MFRFLLFWELIYQEKPVIVLLTVKVLKKRKNNEKRLVLCDRILRNQVESAENPA